MNLMGIFHSAQAVADPAPQRVAAPAWPGTIGLARVEEAAPAIFPGFFSVIVPAFIMALEEFTINNDDPFGIAVDTINDRANLYAVVIDKVVGYLDNHGFASIRGDLLALPVSMPSLKLETVEGVPTLGQCLFNETYSEQLEVLDINDI